MFEKIKKNISIASLLHKKSYIDSLADTPTTTPAIWSKIYYKEYPRFPSILLPTISKLPKKDFFDTLLKRDSSRRYTGEAINITFLSYLLFLSAGITRIDEKNNVHKRTYPSGGGRYPLEIYPIVLRGNPKLTEGIYHYNVKLHSLELIKKKSFINQIIKLTGEINEEVVGNCSIIFVITAIFNRNEIKYGNRSYRYTLLECGHLAQNIYLASTALNLECCAIGGFVDEQLNKLLSLNEKREQSLYVMAVGKAKNTK